MFIQKGNLTMRTDNTIFIQIAAYRDPELIPTINSCIENARYPENLRFGIVWQHDPTENVNNFKSDNRFRILDFSWEESKGLCWARSLTQKLYANENYTLQIDSHHRFDKDWDIRLIDMLKMTDCGKPILTTYAPSYEPGREIDMDKHPLKMVPTTFTHYGTIRFVPRKFEDHECTGKPIRSRFVSGHFFFTYGLHCLEYKYDPNIYFAGDEISLSVRSFTLGYDLFHPHETVIWHQYTRDNRAKHWDDHNIENFNSKKIDSTWLKTDEISKMRIRKLLREENSKINLGIYDIGNKIPFDEYQKYAGIDFKSRSLHRYALEGKEPPVISASASDYSNNLIPPVFVQVDIDKSDFNQYTGCEHFKINVLNTSSDIIHKDLIDNNEINFFKNSPKLEHIIEFHSKDSVASVEIEPVSNEIFYDKIIQYV
jgi:hypothetical protein